MTGLKRIVGHWTGGAYGAIAMERRAYNLLILQDGSAVPGDLLPEANVSTADGRYAAHTRGLNSGSIGLAMDAMAGASERPFDPGPYPITEAQLAGFVEAVADLADTYGIPVTRETVLSHAEVQPTLGVWQRNKWDITWLPGMEAPGDPVEVGDRLRDMIAARLSEAGAAPPAVAVPALARPVLRRGSRGSAVMELQSLLRREGFAIAVDGDIGPATELAVRMFQRRYELADDGIVGPKTWAELAG